MKSKLESKIDEITYKYTNQSEIEYRYEWYCMKEYITEKLMCRMLDNLRLDIVDYLLDILDETKQKRKELEKQIYKPLRKMYELD